MNDLWMLSIQALRSRRGTSTPCGVTWIVSVIASWAFQ